MFINILTTKEVDTVKIAVLFEVQNIQAVFHYPFSPSPDSLEERVKEFCLLNPSKVLVVIPFGKTKFRLGVVQEVGNDLIWFQGDSLEKIISDYILKVYSKKEAELTSREDSFLLKEYTTKRGSVSFDVSPQKWIESNIFFRKLPKIYSKLLNFVLNESGMFLKVWRLESQKNYWNSTFNGGLPIVKKKDPVHEGTFMVHDMWHFVFIDPVILGSESDLEVLTYVAYRMMSEAFTLVLTDMIAVSHSQIKEEGYDVLARKIYPVFENSNIDADDSEGVRKIVHANCVFALFGDTSEYEKLNVEKNILRSFIEKYSIFFSVDMQWNFANAKNQIERLGNQEVDYRFVDVLPKNIRENSTHALYKKIKLPTGEISFESLFEIFWKQYISVISYDKEFSHFEYSRVGIQKYITGQIYVAFQYKQSKESDLLVAKYYECIEKLQTTTKLEDVLDIYKSFNIEFEHYLSYLVQFHNLQSDVLDIYKSFNIEFEHYLSYLVQFHNLQSDDLDTFRLHVPHFPPIYSGYDKPKHTYQTLIDVSKSIFGNKIQ